MVWLSWWCGLKMLGVFMKMICVLLWMVMLCMMVCVVCILWLMIDILVLMRWFIRVDFFVLVVLISVMKLEWVLVGWFVLRLVIMCI